MEHRFYKIGDRTRPTPKDSLSARLTYDVETLQCSECGITIEKSDHPHYEDGPCDGPQPKTFF